MRGNRVLGMMLLLIPSMVLIASQTLTTVVPRWGAFALGLVYLGYAIFLILADERY